MRRTGSWEIALESNDGLGECPVWSAIEGRLYRIDIAAQLFLAYDPDSGSEQIWPLPARPGSFALRRGGGAVFALQTGFAYLDFESGALASGHDPEPDLPENRFNDGACDRAGRFFAGTMDDAEVATTGSLYRLDVDRRSTRVLSGIAISNGIGWSPDDTVMYHVDSARRTVTSYRYDVGTGEIIARRGVVTVPLGSGVPDSLTVDADAGVWVAIWDGFRIVRYLPDGTIDRIIELPIPRPTSCKFGGPDLRTVYVTSAREHLDDDPIARYPLSGSLLAIHVDKPGLKSSRFAG